MNSKCQVCGAKSEVFLCREHTTELREMLHALPWWLDRLSEAAVGQVRMSDGGRRTGRAIRRLDGDTPLVEMLNEYPDERETDLTKARRQRARTTQHRLLASGGVNARASELCDKVRNTITTWLRLMCDQRRTDWVTFVDRGFIGPLLPGQFRRYTYPNVDDAVHWLAWHTNTIATHEWAGECFHDIRGRTRAIERTINPPLATRFLGKCPTWLDHKRAICGTELTCLEDAVQITCPSCRNAHNVNRLQLLMMSDLAREKMTAAQILKLNRILPEEYRVNERTLRRWRRDGKLKPRGWRRDGRDAPTRHTEDDEPLYLWSDVRKLATEKPEQRKAIAR